MASLNNQLFDTILHDDNIDQDLTFLPPDLLDDAEVFHSNEDFLDLINSSLFFPDNNMQTPSGYSPGNNSNSNSHDSSTGISQSAVFPSSMQSDTTEFKIIAQPFYGAKLRYRSDYEKNENRLGVLKNRNKDSSYQGPAISIPKCYLNTNDQYYIRICLVTAIYDTTNLHYFHPYELENPCDAQLNDRKNNAVWYPIKPEDFNGSKSFPTLRIVKMKTSDLKNHGALRVFDCHNRKLQNNFLPQFPDAKKTIKEYNLDRSQLAFTVGKKVLINDQPSFQLYSDTTIYSDEMIEGVGKELDADNENQSLSEVTRPVPSSCRVYNYAPKSGFADSIEDMLIFLTSKLEPRKNGELQVTFQCDSSAGHWEQQIDKLDIKDRMVSLKTPIFPHFVERAMRVDVILRQDNRIIETFNYHYLSTLEQCAACRSTTVSNLTNAIPNVSNKRTSDWIHLDDFQLDGDVPSSDNVPELRQPYLQQTTSAATSSIYTSLPRIHTLQINDDPGQQMMDKLADGIESLFSSNDYTSFLLICRSFIKKRPQIMHNALSNNQTDLLLKFIPIAFIDTFEHKNELGETFLLHAVRLNRLDIVKALLERKKSDTLLEAVDNKTNNIFHILCSNSTSTEIVDLFINRLLENSINIQQKFDHVNQDDQTPLQLSIYKNNLLVTKRLLKHFNTNVYQTQKRTGDNLIHLAVRYGDLTMVKYLIEDGELFQQGDKSNVSMKPIELALSLKRNDIYEYLYDKYPPLEINEDDSCSDDD